MQGPGSGRGLSRPRPGVDEPAGAHGAPGAATTARRCYRIVLAAAPPPPSTTSAAGMVPSVSTMAAGASGINFGLLVVAADDGPMPQTAEHLAIIDAVAAGDNVVRVLPPLNIGEEHIREFVDKMSAAAASIGMSRARA
mgnify:CR=1 FL=1